MSVKIICFTDIKGSTTLTQNLGHEKVKPIIAEHLRVGKEFIHNCKGEYIKNIGDAHLCSFDSYDAAINFAAVFQQFHQKRPCIDRHELEIRVALFQGDTYSLDDDKRDLFGSAVNQAARVEGMTTPCKVTVNADMQRSVISAWGQENTNKYFKSLGEKELKGIEGKQELFDFIWEEYCQESCNNRLAIEIFNCLEKAQTIPTNLNKDDLGSSGFIVWPVVPRDVVTAIHRGQIEIIRLLAFMGWRVYFLVADCGTVSPVPEANTDAFIKLIMKHAKSRGLCEFNYGKLSDYFSVKYEHHEKVIERFRQVTSGLSVQNLIHINQKEYAEEVKEEIKKNSTLNFLRPILTCAAALHLIEDIYSKEPKSIIIAGDDENIQWRYLLDSEPNRLGTIYNPLLRSSDASGKLHTARQSKNWPLWLSKKELLDESKLGNNTAKWVFQLFAQLPAFPSSVVRLGDAELSAIQWKDEFKIPESIDFNNIVDLIWPIIDPAC